MGLEVEDVEEGERRKAVADYVLERDDGDDWEEWLQTHRVELNAMTTPQFIEWLDGKMAEHGYGKLIPPPEVLAAELERSSKRRCAPPSPKRILREADLEGQIEEALTGIRRPTTAALVKGIKQEFERSPDCEWRKHIEEIVEQVSHTGDAADD